MRKKVADENWKSIMSRLESKSKVSRQEMVDAMNQCNAIDQIIIDIDERGYFKKRGEHLYVCDKSIGDSEMDEIHQKYREQYQLTFGEDIKHG